MTLTKTPVKPNPNLIGEEDEPAGEEEDSARSMNRDADLNVQNLDDFLIHFIWMMFIKTQSLYMGKQIPFTHVCLKSLMDTGPVERPYCSGAGAKVLQIYCTIYEACCR